MTRSCHMVRSSFAMSTLPSSHFSRISPTFLNQFYSSATDNLAHRPQVSGQTPASLRALEYYDHDHLANNYRPRPISGAGSLALLPKQKLFCFFGVVELHLVRLTAHMAFPCRGHSFETSSNSRHGGDPCQRHRHFWRFFQCFSASQ